MLPVETIMALFPRPRTVCRAGPFRRIELKPATLAHAAAMEAMGCGVLDGWLDAPKALVAAWLLTLDERGLARVMAGEAAMPGRWARIAKRHVREIHEAVNCHMTGTVLPFVPAKREEGAAAIDDGLPRGYGWPLEVAETLCARYGWTFREAMRTEVSLALALVSVGRERAGGRSGGPDYYDRIRLARMKKAGITGKEANGDGGGE